ncbi:MAG: hypothetical protein KF832_28570 [Caldilineaceae bacterium]|nr:hypothetical protein [Caldilineaceae bacterium]
MSALTLSAALTVVAQMAATTRMWQITDPRHPDYGAIYHRDWGVAEPKSAGKFLISCSYLALADALPDDQLLEQATLAAAYLLRARRPSGLIDLISVNIDSAPDTAFTVQELCTILALARQHPVHHPAWQPLLDQIATFVREAVPAMLSGGFHTPNHRWVIVSALLQAHSLFPELAVYDTVASYLAEEIDLDAEGLFIERSIGVYDAVNNRSLLLIHEHWDAQWPARPPALAAVHTNLQTDLQLLHADGTAETGLSRRQDYGTRQVALGLVPYLLWSDHHQATPTFVTAAHWLWQQALHQANIPITDHEAHVHWLTYVLLKYGEPAAATAALPTSFVRHFPVNGIHRVRRDLLNASFFQSTTRLLTLTYGEAELSSVKISQTYFGQFIGRFVSNTMHFDGATLVLGSAGESNLRRPAYELPLGRPVPPDQWQATMSERALRWLPHAVSTLTVTEVAGGFDLHYQTVAGADQVAAQLAFDFPVGGIWETNDTRTQPSAGQVIFLKQGWGAMRYGPDVIQISPGHLTHGMWAMRDAETAPDHVRVLLTFFTPVDVTIHLRAYRGPLTTLV